MPTTISNKIRLQFNAQTKLLENLTNFVQIHYEK